MRLPGIAIGLSWQGGGWAPVNAETILYITGLVTPLSIPQQKKIDTLVTSLKTGLGIANLSDAFDYIRIQANETEEISLKNLVKNLHHATNVSEMAFTAFEGYTGDGVADYLNANYKLKSQGVRATVNSTSLFVYVRTNQNIAQTDMGARKAAADDRSFINVRSLTGAFEYVYFYINTDVDTLGSVTPMSDGRGLTLASRTANNLTTIYKNGENIGSKTHASSDLPDYDIYEGGLNTADALQVPSTNQIAITGAGRGFNAAEVKVITDAFEGYMDSHSKGVIGPEARCWFSRENAVYNATVNKTWVGLVHKDLTGYTQYIVTLDNATGILSYTKVGSVYSHDDHGDPSILVRASDNKLLIAFAEHGLSTNLRYRLSTNALDATAWGAESQFTASDKATYSQMYQASNGDIYIFYREKAPKGWCYVKSTDDGVTFGTRTNIFCGIGYDTYPGYLISAQSPVDPDIIHFVLSTAHPWYNNDVSVCAFYFDCGDDKFYKLDGTETTANLPFDNISDVTTIMATARPDESWIEDIIVDATGKPRYLFTFLPNAKNVDYLTKDLYYVEWTGAAITTPYKIHTALVGNVHTGVQLNNPNNTYSLMSCFSKNNPNIIVASKQVGGIGEIFKITRIASDNFTSKQKTFNSNYDQWRPFSVNNTQDNVFWLNKKVYVEYVTNMVQALIKSTIT